MSDLIPRDEALRVLVNLRDDAQRRYDQRTISGSVTAMVGHELVAHREAVREVAAIPAIGTCATCAEWRRHKLFGHDLETGECVSDAYIGIRADVVTSHTHFCAAWRAKEQTL